MKKGLLISFVFLVFSMNTIGNDSLKIVSLQREVSNMKTSVSRLQQENTKMRSLYQQQKTNVDSLLEMQRKHTEDLNALANKVGADLSETNKNLQNSTNNLSDSINFRTWMAVCGILIALALLGFVYIFLRKKILSGSSSIDKIRSAQESLETAQKAMQEESIKLDNKLVELLEKQLNQSPEPKQDHSFVLDIANEIARIEQNLSFMDSKVKGVSNLKNRASAINDRLKSKGYEIPKLVGEKYTDGNNMKPTMELDEDLPVGTQIIRRVLKPMVLYKGEMIQAAEVVVAYNE